MKILIFCFVLFCSSLPVRAQVPFIQSPSPGYEERIREHIDTLTVFDTHEHLIDPEMLKKAGFLDFAMLLLENSYNDLISAGMPDTLFNRIFSPGLPPLEKWKTIEPYWKGAFNTANNRILLRAIRDLYGISEFDTSSVLTLSSVMKNLYGDRWFDQVMKSKCKIDFVIMDGPRFSTKREYVRYAQRFDPWLSVRTKFAIDSLAILQVDPIYTLEGFVKSMSSLFERGLKEEMAVIKIDIAYKRPISFDKVTTETARKVFRTLINGNEDLKISYRDAKPLQDYMVFQLLSLAQKHRIPVAFHTGFQAGNRNVISNSNPALLSNVFMEFPDVNFVLFHGAYPYGGELSALAKNFRNVFIDMNWIYSISPSYAADYLNEWLETVPANKIMAFGGDQRMIEMTYGNVILAKKVITDVLAAKVKDGYFTEPEAINVARLILHDNGFRFYNIR